MTFIRERTRPRRRPRLLYRGPDIDTLHDEFARRHRIDDSAPIVASHCVAVAAPITRVWQVLSQPDRWNAVDPAISEVRLDSTVVEGAGFTWRNGKVRLSSRFAVVDRDRELTWTGTALGARVVHRHVLEPTHDGGTRLFSEESMAGPFLVLFFSSKKLQQALDSWLTALSVAAESDETIRAHQSAG